MATVPTAHDWRDSGLIPTSGLEAWHMYEAGASGHEIIYDYSTNGRFIDSAALNSAVLTPNVLYGQPGWYFNGVDTVPLNWTGDLTIKHAFVLASAEEASFTENRGLLGGETVGDILVSEDSGDEFFDLGIGSLLKYRKNDVLFDEDEQEAPMDGSFALLEVSNANGFGLDGIQVGQQRDIAGRIWKGYFVEQLLFSRILTTAERRRVMLYFNIKFALFKLGLTFHFPSDDLMQFRRTRFYAEPPRYEDITDSYEYEDRGKTFNEVADAPPRHWEYSYLARTPEQTVIFDAFWDAARLVHPFIFRDKYGVLWSNVRIEKYNRSHQRHMSWRNDVEFLLVGYNSEGTPETVPVVEAAPTGLALELSTSESLIVSWDGPPDMEAPSVPTMAVSTGITGTTITWNWNAATDNVDVTGYDLQVAEDAGFSVNLQTYNLGDVLTYNDTGLDPSTTYYARVRARDAAPNYSAYSSSTNSTTSAPLVLDLLGTTAATAFGLRKMRSGYAGSAVRVRNNNTNVETDIGFSGNDMDWAAAIAAKGADTITVKPFYDQSGNGKDMASGGTAGREPVLDTSLEVIDFDGSDDLLRTAATVNLSGTNAVTVFFAGKIDAAGSQYVVNVYDAGNRASLIDNGTLFIASQEVGGNGNNKYDNTVTTAQVYSAVFDRSQTGADDTKFYWDGVEVTGSSVSTDLSGNFSATTSVRLAENDATSIGNIKVYELIVVPGAVDDITRAAVEANMKAYYGL